MPWDSVFESVPDPTEDISLGASRITTTKADLRERAETEHNFGTLIAGNTDDGRLNPGAARAFSGTATPTAIKSFNGTNHASLPNASSPALGANDEGRLWIDENTSPGLLRWYDGAQWRPTVVSGVAGAATPVRNRFINGSFEVWQRGFAASAIPTGSNAYWADRWFCRAAGAATATQARVSSGLPTGAVSRFGIQIVGGAGVTTLDIVQRIEAAWCRQMLDVTCLFTWLILYTGGTVTPTILLGEPSAVDDFTVVNNRVTTAHTTAVGNGRIQWVLTMSSATFPTLLANGLEVRVRFPAGSLDNVAENVVITDGMAAVTNTTPPFEHRPLPYELPMCQRYYTKTFPYATPAAQNSAVTAGSLVQYIHSSGDGVGAQWRFPVTMRATPTVTTYNPTAAASTWDEDGGADTQAAALVANASGDSGVQLAAITAGNNGSNYLVQASADAEL